MILWSIAFDGILFISCIALDPLKLGSAGISIPVALVAHSSPHSSVTMLSLMPSASDARVAQPVASENQTGVDDNSKDVAEVMVLFDAKATAVRLEDS